MRRTLTASTPPSTGDIRFDALLAALTEHAVFPAPEWAAQTPPLASIWHLDPADPADVPEAFAAKNIGLRSTELDSV